MTLKERAAEMWDKGEVMTLKEVEAHLEAVVREAAEQVGTDDDEPSRLILAHFGLIPDSTRA
jgi:hypothetical protein